VRDDNPLTPAKVELGRHLFYDVRLSANENTSCATCHQRERAFTDGLARSRGTTGQLTARNTMSLVNSAYAATLTFNNFVLVDLEGQALVPLFGESPIEHGLVHHDARALKRLQDEPRYPPLFAAAFPNDAAPFSILNVVRALASFERTLVSARSPYDRFMAGDADALSGSAQRGLNAFQSARLGCTKCHGGFFFSNALAFPSESGPKPVFENNGLYATYPRGNTGIHELSGRAEDIGKFKPPSLRNVALTGPYMFDGSLATLEEVVDHYARGGQPSATKSPFISGFTLSAAERSELLAFLNSLTDRALIEDERFADPWLEKMPSAVHAP
jgi:cytochrome c peroxidase